MRTSRQRILPVLLCSTVLLLLLLLSACGDEDDSDDSTPGAAATPSATTTPTPPLDPALREVLWRAVSIDGEPVPTNAEVTMSLAEGGRAGCNLYSATFTLGPGNAFHAELGGMTLMGCEEELMRIEDRFTEALREATTYELSADNSELILRDADGNDVRFVQETT